MIPFFGELLFPIKQRHVSRAYRCAQQSNLPAGIIDIIFPIGSEADGFIKIHHDITDGGSPGADDIQWSCGIGADKFNLNFDPVSPITASESVAGENHISQRLPIIIPAEIKIDKTRSRDLNLVDDTWFNVQNFKDFLGDLPGIFFRNRCKLHGYICG